MHILLDVPRKSPPTSHPRPPKTPVEKKERIAPPIYFLTEWRESFGLSFRKMSELTGIDIASLKRAEDRAAGRGEIKNKKKGVDTGILTACAEVFGLTSTEPLKRRPDDDPTEYERFTAAPPEWREDFLRMISRLPKSEQ